MADFWGCVTSSSFRVRDDDAFLADTLVKKLKRRSEFFNKDDDGYWAFGWQDTYPEISGTSEAQQCKNCNQLLIDTDASRMQTHLKQHGPQFEDVDIDDVWDHFDPVDQEFDYAEVIQKHIRPGDVCKLQISGNEKLRYIGGPLVFITHRGCAWFTAETSWEDVITEAQLGDLLFHLVEDIARLLGTPK